MNFDCPGCHAKYQIADEKVATKAVKMKCRKCQTPILISSLGARRALGVSEGRAITMPPGMSVAPVARSLAPPSIPRRRSLGPAEEAGVTLTHAGHAEAPAPAGFDSPGPERGPVKSERSPANGSAGLHKASLPPSRGARLPNSSEEPAPSRAPSLGPDLGKVQIQIRERDMAGPPSLRRMASKIPMETWHVGVAGAVQGPWTRTEIGERIRKGEINGDALVWKDGMSGWAPLRGVDALKDLLAPPPDAPLPEAPAPLAPAPFDVEPSMAKPLAEAPKIDLGSTLSPVTGHEAGRKSEPRRDSLWARMEAKAPKKTHIAFLAVAAAVFGGAMTFAFFGGSETKIVEKVVEVRVKDEVKPADNVPPPPPPDADNGATAHASGVAKTTHAGRPASGDTSGGTAPAAGENKGGLKGLSGLSGLSSAGPQSGPQSGFTPSATQALDSSQVQSTVSRYQSGVKRGCWQPALDSRDKSAPSSARVTVAITVSSSGAVKNVSSSGDPPGYRGLASCIQSRVSAWSFPPSSGTTTVNVPFVFAAQ
jgi:predicted Zn finger-like uncharacterized protein